VLLLNSISSLFSVLWFYADLLLLLA